LASQQQFEGPVLEDLLERVRNEVGPDARIVAANRIRKGGVGGFFAKQAFEVLVEPGDDTPETSTTHEHYGEPVIGPESPSRESAPVAAITSAALVPVRSESRAPTSILELADAVSDDERNEVIDLVEERTVSTESRDFAQVLDRFSLSIDATPEELARDTEPKVESRRGHEEIDLRTTDLAASAAPSVAPAAPTPLPTEPGEPAPRVSDHVDDDDDSIDVVTTLDPPPTPRRARQVASAAEVIDRYETRLSKLGLPARLIPRGVAQPALKGALVESLTQLPPAPNVPAGLGVVVATVGIGATPVLLARDLAAELGLDPDDVMLATREPLGGGVPAWLQMCDAGTAQERRRSWRRRTRPTIVACSLPPVGRGLRWAREILDNLEPTVTWAIVDAGTKREDIAFRVDQLGGVDVLALDGLDDTVSPAAVLELGIPVGRLEQEHASPLTWTELFLERMSS